MRRLRCRSRRPAWLLLVAALVAPAGGLEAYAAIDTSPGGGEYAASRKLLPQGDGFRVGPLFSAPTQRALYLGPSSVFGLDAAGGPEVCNNFGTAYEASLPDGLTPVSAALSYDQQVLYVGTASLLTSVAVSGASRPGVLSQAKARGALLALNVSTGEFLGWGRHGSLYWLTPDPFDRNGSTPVSSPPVVQRLSSTSGSGTGVGFDRVYFATSSAGANAFVATDVLPAGMAARGSSSAGGADATSKSSSSVTAAAAWHCYNPSPITQAAALYTSESVWHTGRRRAGDGPSAFSRGWLYVIDDEGVMTAHDLDSTDPAACHNAGAASGSGGGQPPHVWCRACAAWSSTPGQALQGVVATPPLVLAVGPQDASGSSSSSGASPFPFAAVLLQATAAGMAGGTGSLYAWNLTAGSGSAVRDSQQRVFTSTTVSVSTPFTAAVLGLNGSYATTSGGVTKRSPGLPFRPPALNTGVPTAWGGSGGGPGLGLGQAPPLLAPDQPLRPTPFLEAYTSSSPPIAYLIFGTAGGAIMALEATPLLWPAFPSIMSSSSSSGGVAGAAAVNGGSTTSTLSAAALAAAGSAIPFSPVLTAWYYSFPLALEGGDYILPWVISGPISDGVTVVAATTEGQVAALDAATGTLWWLTHAAADDAFPVIAPGMAVDRFSRLLLATSAGRAAVLTSKTGCGTQAIGYVTVAALGTTLIAGLVAYYCIQGARVRRRLAQQGVTDEFLDSMLPSTRPMRLSHMARLLSWHYKRYAARVLAGRPGGAARLNDSPRDSGADAAGSPRPAVKPSGDGGVPVLSPVQREPGRPGAQSHWRRRGAGATSLSSYFGLAAPGLLVGASSGGEGSSSSGGGVASLSSLSSDGILDSGRGGPSAHPAVQLRLSSSSSSASASGAGTGLRRRGSGLELPTLPLAASAAGSSSAAAPHATSAALPTAQLPGTVLAEPPLFSPGKGGPRWARSISAERDAAAAEGAGGAAPVLALGASVLWPSGSGSGLAEADAAADAVEDWVTRVPAAAVAVSGGTESSGEVAVPPSLPPPVRRPAAPSGDAADTPSLLLVEGAGQPSNAARPPPVAAPPPAPPAQPASSAVEPVPPSSASPPLPIATTPAVIVPAIPLPPHTAATHSGSSAGLKTPSPGRTHGGTLSPTLGATPVPGVSSTGVTPATGSGKPSGRKRGGSGVSIAAFDSRDPWASALPPELNLNITDEDLLSVVTPEDVRAPVARLGDVSSALKEAASRGLKLERGSLRLVSTHSNSSSGGGGGAGSASGRSSVSNTAPGSRRSSTGGLAGYGSIGRLGSGGSSGAVGSPSLQAALESMLQARFSSPRVVAGGGHASVASVHSSSHGPTEGEGGSGVTSPTSAGASPPATIGSAGARELARRRSLATNVLSSLFGPRRGSASAAEPSVTSGSPAAVAAASPVSPTLVGSPVGTSPRLGGVGSPPQRGAAGSLPPLSPLPAAHSDAHRQQQRGPAAAGHGGGSGSGSSILAGLRLSLPHRSRAGSGDTAASSTRASVTIEVAEAEGATSPVVMQETAETPRPVALTMAAQPAPHEGGDASPPAGAEAPADDTVSC